MVLKGDVGNRPAKEAVPMNVPPRKRGENRNRQRHHSPSHSPRYTYSEQEWYVYEHATTSWRIRLFYDDTRPHPYPQIQPQY